MAASDPIDPEASTPVVLMLYGATMLAVQGVEQAVSWLYAVVNMEPERQSNASQQRQVRDITTRLWNAFQKGSAGMRLNDVKKGLRPHLTTELYEELDRFIKGRATSSRTASWSSGSGATPRARTASSRQGPWSSFCVPL